MQEILSVWRVMDISDVITIASSPDKIHKGVLLGFAIGRWSIVNGESKFLPDAIYSDTIQNQSTIKEFFTP